MQGLDQILGSSSTDVAGIAARFGLSPDQAQSALGSLMPAVLGGFQKKAEANDLAPATDAVGDPAQPDTEAGNGVLAHIFGSRSVSQQVADHAEGQSGVPSGVLQAMLPVIAAMVAKHLASQPGGGAGDQPAASAGGLGGMLGSILGGGSAAGGLGGTGAGGNPLDQILARMR